MSLTFVTTNKVQIADAASIRDLATCTILSWIYLTDTTPAADVYVWTKGNFDPGQRSFGVNTSGGLNAFVRRGAGTPTSAVTALANTPAIAQDAWSFVGCCWNTGGANGDQKLFHGNLATLAAEATGYSTQSVGSGTIQSDNALVARIGQYATTNPFAGAIAWVGVWNRVLTLAEIQQQQFHPHLASGCVVFTHLGLMGTGTQPDWSGNGNTGTVTGATVSDHVPLGPLFSYGGSLPYVISAAASIIPQIMHHRKLMAVN